jgi:hypothetical protein
MGAIALLIYIGGVVTCWPVYGVWIHHRWGKRFGHDIHHTGDSVALGFLCSMLWPIGWAIELTV